MLKITQVLQANVMYRVQKTKKRYSRTMNYAKHVTKGHIGKGDDIHEYFLRDGRGWKSVTEEEYNEATSEENVEKLYERLGKELRQRVEGIMSEK